VPQTLLPRLLLHTHNVIMYRIYIIYYVYIVWCAWQAMSEAMCRDSAASKFLIDGFPRNQDNLEGWERAVGDEANLLLVLFFDCTEDVSLPFNCVYLLTAFLYIYSYIYWVCMKQHKPIKNIQKYKNYSKNYKLKLNCILFKRRWNTAVHRVR